MNINTNLAITHTYNLILFKYNLTKFQLYFNIILALKRSDGHHINTKIIKCKITQFTTNSDSKQLTADRSRRRLETKALLELVVEAPRSEQRNLVSKQSRLYKEKRIISR